MYPRRKRVLTKGSDWGDKGQGIHEPQAVVAKQEWDLGGIPQGGLGS